ncbi:TPA: hypothetical protein HML79_24195 [Escherichia coli]|nr:hypothetical protein [Escherichia coli]EFE9091630.1 hypothetical protein [Escherichia coli]EFH9315474.1 hypothetical protein [Escherichia coli]EFN7456378.1 hypothetical protein [Escherichia coli]EFN7514037.1 hypothetical protein [Escherichia coli]
MKQSAGNINDKTSRFFRQTNNISKYDSSRRGKKFFTCTILKKMGRHTWKVSPQTESPEQKQCAGAKGR